MIRLIAAIDSKRGIAKGGHIPWDLPSDQERFRSLTLSQGANVLMGSTTYSQMSSSYIKERNSFVASRENTQLPNATLVLDINKFISDFNGDLWIIGGALVYDATIALANELYLTVINANFNCDKFFPDYSNFTLKSSDGPHIENGLSFNYQLLTRF
ncbi:MAG: dihydrofolate reductase [Candidatus Saccharimonadales bacterium]